MSNQPTPALVPLPSLDATAAEIYAVGRKVCFIAKQGTEFCAWTTGCRDRRTMIPGDPVFGTIVKTICSVDQLICKVELDGGDWFLMMDARNLYTA